MSLIDKQFLKVKHEALKSETKYKLYTNTDNIDRRVMLNRFLLRQELTEVFSERNLLTDFQIGSAHIISRVKKLLL